MSEGAPGRTADPPPSPDGTAADDIDGLLDGVLEVTRVQSAEIALVDPSRRFLTTAAVRGHETGGGPGARTPIGSGFAGRVAAERATRAVQGFAAPDGTPTGSLLGVPLLAGHRTLGVLTVGSREDRRFSDDETALLEGVGSRIAARIAEGLPAAERAAAAALRQGLGPPGIPDVPGLEFAARHMPADADRTGGDWYDIVPVPSGSVWVVVGDVAGRGLPAVLAAARLSSALRAYSTEVGGDPAELLSRLDRHICQYEPDVMATVLCALIDPDTDRIVVSSAGHPPAVVSARADVPAAALDVPTDLPIGVDPYRRRRSSAMTLPPGTTICLYTDGLVHHRGRTPQAGIEQLCRAVFAGAPDVVCSVVLADLIGDRRVEDDVAVLVVRRPMIDRTEPLTLRMPAQPTSLQPLRAATRRWLAAVGQAPAPAGDLLVAIGEAVANVVEHAYGPRGGEVFLHLAVEPPDVVAVVRDTGRWRAPRGQHRGRGSTLMAELSDEVSVDRTDGGTRVVIRRALDRSHS
jgi:anti-sigma regulatory factor (Ser/Thr protein kinase)